MPLDYTGSRSRLRPDPSRFKQKSAPEVLTIPLMHRAESMDTILDGDHELELDRIALPTLLDADPIPSFVVAIDPAVAIEFRILFHNSAFASHPDLCSQIGSKDQNLSLRFRSWCQASSGWRNKYEFADRTFSAFMIKGCYKVVRVVNFHPRHLAAAPPQRPSDVQDLASKMREPKVVDAKLESLQRMMEMSDVGTFEYSPAGKLLQANNAWYRLSSYPQDVELHESYSFMDLVYEPDRPLVMSKWNLLTQGIPVTFEMRWNTQQKDPENENALIDGPPQWVLSACVPIMDDDGNLVSITGNTIDINAQKRSQEEANQRAETLEQLRRIEYRFERFAALSSIALYVYGPNRELQYCNDQFFELCGVAQMPYHMIEREDYIHPEDLEAVDAGWHTLSEEKKPCQVAFRLKKQWIDGGGNVHPVWAQSSAYPELNKDGSVRSIMGTMTDITQWKWAESVQKHRMEEALEAKRQQENFIDMTSHEMRNPLSAVIQCADSTITSLTSIEKHICQWQLSDNSYKNQDKITDEISSCMDALQTIISCSLHQKRIIDDILTLSKLDSSLILITPIRVQPVTVVWEAVKMFEVECSKDDISLKFHEDESLKENRFDWVMLDPSRVLQVLINLLTNAIKFTRERPTKSITVTLGACFSKPPDWGSRNNTSNIRLAPSRTAVRDLADLPEWGSGRKGYIWITVQDTGCGLSPAEQGNLFERFSQATPRTHVQYGGSGLGLFISKSLTELQNGQIGVKSEAGVGSTFAFYIRTRIAQTPAGEDDSNRRLSQNMDEDSMQEAVRTAHYSILVVEDNIVNQKVLSKQLQKAGCEVHVAGHGEDALEFLRRSKYWRGQEHTGEQLDIILMDIEMPVMDGLTCARRIREAQACGDVVDHVPILAVSANARSEQVMQAKCAGMDDAISKPFRIHELLVKVQGMLQSRASVSR